MSSFDYFETVVASSMELFHQVRRWQTELRCLERDGMTSSLMARGLRDKIERANEEILFNKAEMILARERFQRRNQD